MSRLMGGKKKASLPPLESKPSTEVYLSIKNRIYLMLYYHLENGTKMESILFNMFHMHQHLEKMLLIYKKH